MSGIPAISRSISLGPFDLLVGLLLLGYLLLSRTFAHLGIAPLYVGEVSLGLYLVTRPASLLRPWLSSLAIPSHLSGVGWWLVISIGYSVIILLSGLFVGAVNIYAAQNLTFVIYPLFLIIGFWVGQRHPEFLRQIIHILAWCTAIYGMAYIGLLSPMGLTDSVENPSAVNWFGQPGGSAAVLLGLLAFEPNSRRIAMPLILNLLVVLGMQRRAEWLSIFVGISLWAFLAGRMRQLFATCFTVLFILGIGLVFDIRVSSPASRGGVISAREIVGRAVSAIDPSLAAGFARNADFYGSTVSWRTDFWSAIWKEVHASPSLSFYGLGYDYPLWELHPEDLSDNPVRSPHSSYMFALAYTGWIGVLVFVGLQLAIGRLMWRAYRISGEPFGFCYWVSVMAWVPLDIYLETPYHAIPTYLLLGLASGMAFNLPEDTGRTLRNGYCEKALAP